MAVEMSFLERLRQRILDNGRRDSTPRLDDWITRRDERRETGSLLRDRVRGFLDTPREERTAADRPFPGLYNFRSTNANALIGAGTQLLSGGPNAWGNAGQAFMQGRGMDQEIAERQRQQQEREAYEAAVATGDPSAIIPYLSPGDAYSALAGSGSGWREEERVINGVRVLGQADPDGRFHPYDEAYQDLPEESGEVTRALTGEEVQQLIDSGVALDPNSPYEITGTLEQLESLQGNIDRINAPDSRGIRITSPDGTITQIGALGDDLNVSQANALIYSARMAQAQDILNIWGDQGTILGQRLISAVTPEVFGNLGLSSDYQQFLQARDNFINAALRRESGAQINESEYANAERQYMPVPGDGPEVLEQKRLNRELAVRLMAAGVSPGFDPYAAYREALAVGVSIPPPGSPASPSDIPMFVHPETNEQFGEGDIVIINGQQLRLRIENGRWIGDPVQ